MTDKQQMAADACELLLRLVPQVLNVLDPIKSSKLCTEIRAAIRPLKQLEAQQSLRDVARHTLEAGCTERGLDTEGESQSLLNRIINHEVMADRHVPSSFPVANKTRRPHLSFGRKNVPIVGYAMKHLTGGDLGFSWVEDTTLFDDNWLRIKLSSTPALPDGWKAAPPTMTREMADAWAQAMLEGRPVWPAVLAAMPAPTSEVLDTSAASSEDVSNEMLMSEELADLRRRVEFSCEVLEEESYSSKNLERLIEISKAATDKQSLLMKLNPPENEVLTQLAHDKELSREGLMRQALRLYQLVDRSTTKELKMVFADTAGNIVDPSDF